jgi:ComF family protein
MDGETPSLQERAGLRRLAPALAGLVRKAADLALPPLCIACEAPVAGHGGLCARCWGSLTLIERPYCDRLGTPFAYDLGPGALSAEAIATPPPFRRLRAVAGFGGVARDLVHALKYRDRLDLARWMSAWMARAGAELIADTDMVVPVPLHRVRLWWRRFNQAGELARQIAEITRKPYAPQVLKRVRSTPHQVGLSAAERQKNVRGAFQVAPDGRIAIAGRRVLLVDDVFTTGATVEAATRALLRGGAASVECLVFARVVRE